MGFKIFAPLCVGRFSAILSFRVSIIIPAYNAAAYLAEAIQSAINQTHKVNSVIVVDDGSTDGTSDVAGQFVSQVKLLHQPNAGVCVARNLGVAETDADWLLFLDADDRLLPGAVERLLQRAQLGDPGVVYGNAITFDDAKSIRRLDERMNCEGAVPVAARANFWKSVPSTPGAAMIRASLFRELGGWNVSYNTAADRDMWVKTGVLAEWGHIAEAVLEKRSHGDNMSGNLDRARIQATQVQLGFLDWCASRSIDTTFLQTSPLEIMDRNIDRALEQRAFEATRWLCEEAGRRGISSDIVSKAQRLLALPKLMREVELKVREVFR